jgi:hypothetical protein
MIYPSYEFVNVSYPQIGHVVAQTEKWLETEITALFIF